MRHFNPGTKFRLERLSSPNVICLTGQRWGHPSPERDAWEKFDIHDTRRTNVASSSHEWTLLSDGKVLRASSCRIRSHHPIADIRSRNMMQSVYWWISTQNAFRRVAVTDLLDYIGRLECRQKEYKTLNNCIRCNKYGDKVEENRPNNVNNENRIFLDEKWKVIKRN